MDSINTPCFPLAAFGSIAYFQQLTAAKIILLETTDHFPKQTFRNRYVVHTPQGVLRLTIPLIKSNGSKTVTKDIRLSRQENWPVFHWRGIKSAYASAPYFEHYASDVQSLLEQKVDFLLDFHLETLDFFNRTWKLGITHSLTPEFLPSYQHDFRDVDFDKSENLLQNISYTQVFFEHPQSFVPNLSVLDLLFCEGPMGRLKLTEI